MGGTRTGAQSVAGMADTLLQGAVAGPAGLDARGRACAGTGGDGGDGLAADYGARG